MSFRRKTLIILIKFLLIILIIAMPSVSAVFGGYLILKTYNVSKIISGIGYLEKNPNKAENAQTQSKTQKIIAQTKQLVGLENPTFRWGQKDRINILLLGKASEDYPGSALTDTVILASINPQDYSAGMLSIPRDLYTQIPDTNTYTKLNAIYHYGTQKEGEKGGISYISRSVQEITGQNVDYFIMLDFKGFTKLIDEIGGIEVQVEKDIYDDRYPGPNYSYQIFEIKKGFHKMDGETALKYVRTRHDADGDFGRAYRQQQVLSAIGKKFFSLDISLVGKINSILEIISQNVKTDIEFNEYGSFLSLTKNVNTHNLSNKVIDNRGAKPILVNYSPWVKGKRAYFLKPVVKDCSQIHEIAENIMNLNKLSRIYEKREQEKPNILLVGNPQSQSASDLEEIRGKLKQAGFDQVKLEQNKAKLSISEELDAAENQYPPKTVVYDNSGGLKPYSFDFLLKLFQARADTGGHNEFKDHDLVIILGGDADIMVKNEDIALPQEAFTY